MADQVMRRPESDFGAGRAATTPTSHVHVQRACAGCENEEEPVRRKPLASQISPLVQRQVNSEETALRPEVATQVEALEGRGRPLSGVERAYFEPRFGVDFGRVRLHAGGEASQTARALGARAFTVGEHVAFGSGEYARETAAGRRLMAHELTHVVQQGASPSGFAPHALPVQRQPSGGQDAASGVTAQDIFPVPQGSRVVLGRIMPNTQFALLSRFDPQTAAALRVMDGQEAVVTTATPDLFEATIAGPVTLPAAREQPERTLRDITLRLQRSGGTFDFGLSATEGEQTTPVTLMAYSGLTARREEGGIVLSSGTGPDLTPLLRATSSAPGQAQLSVFTASFLSQVPEWARRLVPASIEVLGLRQLPPAATRAEAQEAAASMTAGRNVRRQQLSLSAGVQVAGEQVAPLLTTSWRMRFPVTEGVVGQFVHIPLEVQLQYAPDTTVLAHLTSGVTGSLAPLEIPLNLTILAGVAGGQVEVPVGPAVTEPRGAFGITAGAGAELELGVFRVHARYEHVFNLIESGPNVNNFTLGAGVAF